MVDEILREKERKRKEREESGLNAKEYKEYIKEKKYQEFKLNAKNFLKDNKRYHSFKQRVRDLREELKNIMI